MRTIPYQHVVTAVQACCLQAAYDLPEDVLAALRRAAAEEESALGRSILEQCLANAALASRDRVAICQDTGVAVFFVERGADLRIEGGLLVEAIQAGMAAGYHSGYLRASMVADPLYERRNTGDNTPAIIHVEEVLGDGLTITLAPKGGGSENMSTLAMLKPHQGERGVIDLVVDTVCHGGGNPCPPTVVGVGIGGNLEHAALLAKRALIRDIGSPHPDPAYADLERRILAAVNATGVGPQGLGGSVTALAVHIETAPCHIASLPVAVNLNCHAARHAEVSL